MMGRECVEMLIRGGADVNIQNKHGESAYSYIRKDINI